jgi:hypothetical protein
MSYNPGTLFRAYNADKSKHYTAVLLKDGKVLEVKNPDTNTKTTYDSFELWKVEHPDCSIDVDATKSNGVVIGLEYNGFNYPTEKHDAYIWVQWCYEMVKEAEPSLLNSEEFKVAYNKMVDVCTKHKDELCCYERYSLSDRYSSTNIRWINDSKYIPNWFGFAARFRNENSYNKRTYSATEYESARNEILVAYKSVLDIIKPHIENYMNKKCKALVSKQKISYIKRSIKHKEKKISELQSRVDGLKSYLQEEYANLTKLEEYMSMD